MIFEIKHVAKKYDAVEITEFCEEIYQLEKPGKRGKARIFCQTCQRWHHLHWGEFQGALERQATSLQEIIDQHSWKYCQ